MLCSLSFIALLCVQSNAQVDFHPIRDLPKIGDHCRAYVTTTAVPISSLLGQPGGPRKWDFSQSQQGNEVIKRLDVVPPDDGGIPPLFPQAEYADRLTTESTGERNWSYYRVVTNEGRWYYGFQDTNSNPDCPVKIFAPPTLDLPDPIQFGQTWSRALDFMDCIGFFNLFVHFTAEASVDAYGTVVLPGIGEVPALRVNEIHRYDYRDDLGIFSYTAYYRNYYWLVPGIGKAVDIISEADLSAPPPANLTTARTLYRVFEASHLQAPPHPVADLRIRVQAGQAILDWQNETNVSGYRVESIQNLGTTNWALVGEPSTNTWTQAVGTNLQRFFRVFAKP